MYLSKTNEWERIEWNGMYLSKKGMRKNGMESSNLN